MVGGVAGVLAGLAGMIDGLVGLDRSVWADGELLVGLEQQFARLEAVTCSAVAAFDTSGTWAVDGARNAVAWLATRCRTPKEQARRQVRLGRTLRVLPGCADAWHAGEISAAHVARVAQVRRPATVDVLARDEGTLVEHARTLRYGDFSRVVAYWEQAADPDGVEHAALRNTERRAVHLSASFTGMWLGALTLDPVGGSIVADELARLETELFTAEWADIREQLGREPTVSDLSRTPAQRRADALVEMATRSRTAPPDGRRPAPLFTVLVDYDTLAGRVCELAAGTVLTPGSLLPWLDQTYIERAVFKPNNRIEVSATTRLFTGTTRRAIEIRDRQCAHPYCDIPAAACQGDHIQPYSTGGPTTQDNGRLLCPYHNHLHTQRPPPT